MREIVLVMPCETDAQSRQCMKLEDDLLRVFGAYSEYNGRGVWRNEKGEEFVETHARFVVAVEKGREQQAVELLRVRARLAGEQAIYFVDGDGEAHVEEVQSDVERVAP